MKRLIVASVTAAALLSFAAPAEATQPHRLCGPEVELSGIPGHLDVEINGTTYRRPGSGPWSVTFEDTDGRFGVRFFNEAGAWGTTHYDVGPAQVCATTAPVTEQPTAVTGPKAAPTDVASATAPTTVPTEVRGATVTSGAPTLPETGSSITLPLVGALLAGGGLALLAASRRRASA